MKPSGTRGQGGARGGEANGWGNWALDLYAPTQEALGLGSGARPHLVFVSEHLYSEQTLPAPTWRAGAHMHTQSGRSSEQGAGAWGQAAVGL